MSKKVLKPTENTFKCPPPDPIAILKEWFGNAFEQAIKEPGALSLATTDLNGRSSNRIVQILDIGTPLIFATHTNSQKGKDIASTGWASGVVYWRETKQQIILSGPVLKLSNNDSDTLWLNRHPSTYPMSTASCQSAILEDENQLRALAQKLANSNTVLPRPEGWCGYALHPESIEFWQAADDRLHLRLRYDVSESGWSHCRLQP